MNFWARRVTDGEPSEACQDSLRSCLKSRRADQPFLLVRVNYTSLPVDWRAVPKQSRNYYQCSSVQREGKK